MNIPLQQWYSEWLEEHKDTDLIYAGPGKPSLSQVHFVRDVLAPAMWHSTAYNDLPRVEIPDRYPVDQDMKTRSVLDLVRVVGEHTSKSVRIQYMRGFNTKETDCFFEGFTTGSVYGPWISNPRIFSFCARNDYELYAWVRNLVYAKPGE